MSTRFAKKHDYLGFYKQDIENRKELGYPPFDHLIKLMYNDKNADAAEKEAHRMTDSIKMLFSGSINVIGPSPSFKPKMANKFRWQIILKVEGKEVLTVTKKLITLLEDNWVADVDPIGII